MERCYRITVVNLRSDCVGVEVVATRSDSRQDRIMVWKEMCRTTGPLPPGVYYIHLLLADHMLPLDGHSVLMVLSDTRTEVVRHPLITAGGPMVVSTG